MANRVGMGTGNLKDPAKLAASWEETASGVVRPRQPATPHSVWGGLAALPGQKVILVPRKKAAPDGD